MKRAAGMSSETNGAEAVRDGRSRKKLAPLLSGGGVATSLALMACCALPPLLASVGLAGAWTLDVQTFLGPHENLLFWVSLGSLGAATVAWIWQIRSACSGCSPGGHVIGGVLTPAMLVVGACLTWLALHPI